MQNGNNTIHKSWADKISFWHWAIFLFLLPWDFFYTQLILISYAFHSLVQLRRLKMNRVTGFTILFLSALFLLNFIGMIYTQHPKEGWQITGRQSVLVIIPLWIWLSDFDLVKYRRSLLRAFVFGVAFAVIFLFGNAALQSGLFSKPLFHPSLINHKFSEQIGIHATYMSVYVVFALCILISDFMAQRRLGWLNALLAIILLAGMLQLASRAAVIAFFLCFLFVVPLSLRSAKLRRQLMIAAAVCVVLTTLLLAFNPALKQRFVSGLKYDLVEISGKDMLEEPRVERWKLILDYIGRSPFWGYGTGAEIPVLKEAYFQKQMYSSYLNEFNTHSQYLSYAFCLGLPGLALYLFVLFRSARIAWRKRDALFLCFVTIVMLISVSENLLYLNKGLFFYGFFITLFVWPERLLSNPNQTKNDF